MSIVLISGPSKSGKTLIANALRNNQIAQKKGALLLDETQDGDPAALLEKIIVAEPIVPGTPFDKIPWKPESMVICVGDKAKLLDAFEAISPGFRAGMGATFTIVTGK